MKPIVMGAIVAGLVGCSNTTSPPSSLPSDVGAEVTCVISELQNGVTSISTIASACTKNEEAIAADIVEWLLSLASVQQKVGANLMAERQAVAHWRLAHPPQAQQP
jgi:hypothetical protein